MDRTDQILKLLTTHKTLSNKQLCDALFCSPSSLRRDLIQLEQTGSVRRIRGGATLISGTNFEYSSNYRENFNRPQKQYICSIAQDFLSSGMSLFLDSSSTVLQICPILDKLNDITVITNGIGTALRLNNTDHIDTFITGGHLLNGSSSLTGETASRYIDNFKADLAIISCRGIDSDGAFEADINQSLIKQHMMHCSKHTLLLADSGKFGTSFIHRLCDFSNLLAVITDAPPASAIEQAILDSGCELLF